MPEFEQLLSAEAVARLAAAVGDLYPAEPDEPEDQDDGGDGQQHD